MRRQLLAIFLIPLLFLSAVSMASTYEASKTSGGIKAVVRIDSAKSMVDLYLYDQSKSLRPMLEAKAALKATLPGGKVVEKELIGMDMDGRFSYMNTLDMSEKGRYILDIKITADGRKASFSFQFEIR